jgi:hypothetical protein
LEEVQMQLEDLEAREEPLEAHQMVEEEEEELHHWGLEGLSMEVYLLVQEDPLWEEWDDLMLHLE